jgi:hypothetical protein
MPYCIDTQGKPRHYNTTSRKRGASCTPATPLEAKLALHEWRKKLETENGNGK